MKTEFLYIFAIVAIALGKSIMAFGQDEFMPILSEGKKWRVSAQYLQSEAPIFYLFSVEKDTVINEKPVKKIICIAEDETEDYESQSFYAMEREGVLTGFYLSPDHSGNLTDFIWYEEPVLDMTMDKGAVFSGLTVEKVDYITVHEVKRLRDTFVIDDSMNIGPVYWVEGIGASNSFGWMFRWIPKPTGSNVMNSYSVNSAYLITVEQVFEGENIIFTKDDFRVDTGIQDLGVNQYLDKAKFDIYGRSVQKPAKGSIFIQNGQKMIQR